MKVTNMKKINIVYTPINDTYLLNIVSMQSLLCNNENAVFNFYLVIDYSFENEHLSVIKRFIDRQSNVNLSIIKINFDKYRYQKEHLLFTNRLYAFEFGNLINEDKILYLNEFCIVNSNIEKFYNTDLENYCAAACEYSFAESVENYENGNFIANNNVQLINLNQYRKLNIFEKFNEFLKSSHEDILDDLYISNKILTYKKIDYEWNYTEDWYRKNKKLNCSKETKNKYKQFLSHIEIPKIITFIGPKPLGSEPCKNSYINLWWEYAERTPIYNEIKEFRKLNKYKLSATSAQNSFKYSWLLSRIWPYIKPYWFRILLGFTIAIPLGLLDGVTAFALKPYMDYVVGGKEFALSWHGINFTITSIQMSLLLPVGVVLFAAVQGVLRYLNDYISAWTSQRITNDVKFDLFHRLIHMHPQFFDENSSGIIISRYMGDPQTASAGIVEQLKTIATALFGALGLIAVMLYSSCRLAIIGVLVLCIAFVPVALIRKRIKEASNKNMVIGGNITTNINETYSGNKVMAAYALQDRQETFFRKQVTDSFNINMSLTKRAAWMSPMMYLIASFGIATVLGYGTFLINSGQMTAGAFASFVTSLLLLYKPVKTLGNTLTGIQNIFVAMGRVFELFDLVPEIKDCENPKTLAGLQNSIEFRDVNFEYIPNHPVLKNFNLSVQKNETLAIVGNSGGGKSTLVNLIPRFYDIKSGSIKFDGVDIGEFSLSSLRHNVSMVFQDNFLFSGSIKENILMGNPDASMDELNLAIQSAHLEEMINELPEGLETMLGERGLTLSGGQRQRVAIARAMLRNAPIVILDEATSALDNESEAIVQKAMDNLMQNRTVFIIAHRLSTIKNADRIAVINEGELVELGTHDDLMNIENGHYRALYEMQFKKQESASIV